MSGSEILKEAQEESERRKQNNGPLTVFADFN